VEWKEEEVTFASRRRLAADKGRRKPVHMGRQVKPGQWPTDSIGEVAGGGPLASRSCHLNFFLIFKISTNFVI
jgi:hypothetical protein